MVLPTHSKGDGVINLVSISALDVVFFKPKLTENVGCENVTIFTHWILSQYEQKCCRNGT